MKRVQFPMRIRRGSSVVSIYRTPKQNYASFTVAHYDAGGRRCRKTYSELTKAVEAANQVAKALAAGRTDFLTLTGSELLAYRRALTALEKWDVPIDVAAFEFAQAAQTLGTSGIHAAISTRISAYSTKVEPKLVAEVVRELLVSKAEKGRSELYQQDLRVRLDRVAAAFPKPLCKITPREIDDFLTALPVSARTRNNFRAVIGTLIRFGQQRGYVHREHPGVTDIDKSTSVTGDVRIFTPDDFRTLLRNAKPELVPALVIGAFAGARSEEIKRLRWEDVKLSQGHVEIKSVNSKTRIRRLIPIQKNLREWLKPYTRATGLVSPYANLALQFAKLARRSGLRWVKNGLRHSFISHRTAQLKNLPAVALESGNSVQIIARHYLKVVTSAEAKRWFGISPELPCAEDISPQQKQVEKE